MQSSLATPFTQLWLFGAIAVAAIVVIRIVRVQHQRQVVDCKLGVRDVLRVLFYLIVLLPVSFLHLALVWLALSALDGAMPVFYLVTFLIVASWACFVRFSFRQMFKRWLPERSA